MWSDVQAIFRAIESEDIDEVRKCVRLVETIEVNNRNDDAEIDPGNASDLKNILATDRKKNLLPPEDEKVLLERMVVRCDPLSLRDSCGLTPLLFAADRGILEVS